MAFFVNGLHPCYMYSVLNADQREGGCNLEKVVSRSQQGQRSKSRTKIDILYKSHCFSHKNVKNIHKWYFFYEKRHKTIEIYQNFDDVSYFHENINKIMKKISKYFVKSRCIVEFC